MSTAVSKHDRLQTDGLSGHERSAVEWRLAIIGPKREANDPEVQALYRIVKIDDAVKRRALSGVPFPEYDIQCIDRAFEAWKKFSARDAMRERVAMSGLTDAERMALVARHDAIRAFGEPMNEDLPVLVPLEFLLKRDDALKAGTPQLRDHIVDRHVELIQETVSMYEQDAWTDIRKRIAAECVDQPVVDDPGVEEVDLDYCLDPKAEGFDSFFCSSIRFGLGVHSVSMAFAESAIEASIGTRYEKSRFILGLRRWRERNS